MLFFSCNKDTTADKELMYGKWLTQDSTYYRFDRTSEQYAIHDGSTVAVNGARWSAKVEEDVSEDEAQPFVWSLDAADLTIVHQGYMGEKVPKTYTVKSQTKSSMQWKDDYGNTISLAKK